MYALGTLVKGQIQVLATEIYMLYFKDRMGSGSRLKMFLSS